MKRREFLEYGALLGASALWPKVSLPGTPGFRTKHLVLVIYGAGARKRDVVDNPENAPCQTKLIPEGTLFTEDYGEAASLHGYLYSEILTGVDSPSQRPLFPTLNEYVRKKTGGRASDFWVLQGVSYYRGWTYDVKHFSRHRDYGLPWGATSLTMNKLFREESQRSPRELLDLFIEKDLGHTPRERKDIEEWIADVLARRSHVPPSTKTPLVGRELPYGDAQALHLAPQILKAFRPKILTVQILGLDDAHADFGGSSYETGFETYVQHLRATDELIGKMWAEVQADPYLRDRTALVLRPECGRDGEIDPCGQLGHSPGDYDAHYVWTMAIGPDFKKGHVVTEKVQRQDLAPTLTYLMSGETAELATGQVRTQMFRDEYRLPAYRRPFAAEGVDPDAPRSSQG